MDRGAQRADDFPPPSREATTLYPPEQTIRSIKLYHRQVYAYAYHRSKLTLLRCNP
jgi:hypothetical protein